MPRSRQNILLNFQLKNEASRANLNKNKRIFKWWPFWNKVYRPNRLTQCCSQFKPFGKKKCFVPGISLSFEYECYNIMQIHSLKCQPSPRLPCQTVARLARLAGEARRRLTLQTSKYNTQRILIPGDLNWVQH